MKKQYGAIIVGLDFSPYSKIVLKQAQKLGSIFGSKIIAVYASETPYYSVGLAGSLETGALGVDDLKRDLEKFYDLNKKKIESWATMGGAAFSLVRIADKYENPLIIVGYRGHSKISKILLGSTTDELVRRSPYALWIHRGTKVIHPRKILVPHDLKDSTEASIKAANHFSGSKPVSIEALIVTEIPTPVLDYANWITEFQKEIEGTAEAIKAFKKIHPKIKVSHVEGDPIKTILKSEPKFDLVIMHPHNHAELFHSQGKTTKKIIGASKGPVFVVK